MSGGIVFDLWFILALSGTAGIVLLFGWLLDHPKGPSGKDDWVDREWAELQKWGRKR